MNGSRNIIAVAATFSIVLVGCDSNEIDAPTSTSGVTAVEPGGSSVEVEDDANRTSFAGISGVLPETWESETPSSSMRAVQMTVPGVDDAEDATFVIFGGISGTVADNVARWEGQFTDEAGGPIAAEIVEETIANLQVTTATLNGTYSGGMNGEFAGPGVTMIHTIVEKPSGEMVFFRLLGPAETVAAHRDALFELLDTLK